MARSFLSFPVAMPCNSSSYSSSSSFLNTHRPASVVLPLSPPLSACAAHSPSPALPSPRAPHEPFPHHPHHSLLGFAAAASPPTAAAFAPGPPIMSMWPLHSKRKEPEEAVVELFRNVSLSPPKRVRVSDSWALSNSWPTPSFESQAEVHIAPLQAEEVPAAPLSPPPSPPSPPTVATANRATGVSEEKAIVLYKPVNPPLFPGGPPTGSPETPFVVDTTGVLAACKGTGNSGPSVDAGHASSALNNSSDSHIWTGLFEALDLQGRKSLLPTRRLQRTSSCSSLPQQSSSMDDSSMEEETDPQPSKQLALIPYSPSPLLAAAINTAVQASPSAGADLNEEMVDDVDAMDVTEETMPAGDGVAPEAGSQFGSPIPTFGSAQWEPCDMFKAPYSKVMWSH